MHVQSRCNAGANFGTTKAKDLGLQQLSKHRYFGKLEILKRSFSSRRLQCQKRGKGHSHLFKGSGPTGALDLAGDMLPGDSLAVQLPSPDELVYSALGSGVEVPHDHAQGVIIALAYNVVHDIQQGPQLSNLHARSGLLESCVQIMLTCDEGCCSRLKKSGSKSVLDL